MEKFNIEIQCTKNSYWQPQYKIFHHLFSGKDSCSGDSGGPLVSQDDGDFKSPKYLVGIVSFGTKKCATGYPGVYTSIDCYLPWIIANMKA